MVLRFVVPEAVVFCQVSVFNRSNAFFVAVLYLDLVVPIFVSLNEDSQVFHIKKFSSEKLSIRSKAALVSKIFQAQISLNNFAVHKVAINDCIWASYVNASSVIMVLVFLAQNHKAVKENTHRQLSKG